MHNFSQLLLDCLVHKRDGEEAKKIKKRNGKKGGEERKEDWEVMK